MGTCGISSGADESPAVLKEELKSSKRKDIFDHHFRLCGICNREPLITVERVGEEPVKYADVTRKSAERFFVRHVLSGEAIPEWVFRKRVGAKGDGF